MGQMGFFDVSKRYAGLDAKSDPLVKLNATSPGRISGRSWKRSGAGRRRPENPRLAASRGMWS